MKQNYLLLSVLYIALLSCSNQDPQTQNLSEVNDCYGFNLLEKKYPEGVRRMIMRELRLELTHMNSDSDFYIEFLESVVFHEFTSFAEEHLEDQRIQSFLIKMGTLCHDVEVITKQE